ncbi:transporter [Geovibrio sp. ADMFC3]
MKKQLGLKTLLTCMFMFCLALSAAAQDYPLGSEGLKAATLPGPGFYYVMYNQYYTSDELKDADGDKIDNGFDATIFAMAHRFVYVTNKKIFGADYGMNLIVPTVNLNIEMSGIGVDDSSTGIGDITIEPIALAWHKPRYDALLAGAVYLPTGEYDERDAANIGSDHFTFQLSGGYTVYFDPERLWHFGFLARYEKHLENRATDVTFGDDVDIDYGLGRTFGLWDVGISGYAHWQVTEDKGSDKTTDEKDRIFAVGPEVQYTIPALKGQIVAKYYKEFGARDTKEGDAFWLKLVKAF